MTERRLAFDTRAYVKPGSRKEAFASQLTAYVREASEGEKIADRVNYYRLVKVLGEDGQPAKVVDPNLSSEDISVFYVYKTEINKRESLAGNKMRTGVLENPSNTSMLWISPSGGESNYREGRMVIQANDPDGADCYGICLPESFTRFLEVSKQLTGFLEIDAISGIEELRETPITLPIPEEELLFLMKKVIPELDEVWDYIASGKAKSKKDKVYHDAQWVAERVRPMIVAARTPMDFIRAGAAAERLMISKGHKIGVSSCGERNIDLLGSSSPLSVSSSIRKPGMMSETSGGKKFIKNCGNCGRKLNRQMKAGDKCPFCGGTYLGC